jgi:tRNA nucleotidyltransferase (CCA-adding enzyme)
MKGVELIVTHDMTDFDGIASAVLAQKLHPGAVIALGRRLADPVRDYMTLHKDRFPTRSHADIDVSTVERLICVDVRRRSRLRDFRGVVERILAGEVDGHVWDHHGASADDVPASFERVERVGAAVTLLVEELRRRSIGIDAVEATLAALGIHSDTGSLTFGSTTPRDVDALAHALRRGASLAVLDRYLRLALTPRQREVLSALVCSVEVEVVGGVPIGFGLVPLTKAVCGLAEVTTRALELDEHGALFGIFPIGDRRVQVVARSRTEAVDVGRALRAIGGGGHPSAGSAITRGPDGGAVKRTLLAALRASPPMPRVLSEIMSCPVRSVSPEVELGQLEEKLAAWGHTGVPVVVDGRLVGVVSGRDVARARHDGRLHLPVSSCMSHGVRTATEHTAIDEALAMMSDADVGRLPILRGERVVGIVSRSDLLGVLYSTASGDQRARK